MQKSHPLPEMLKIAVPLHILQIHAKGGITNENWHEYRAFIEYFNSRCIEEPSFTESMLFKTKTGQSAQAFNHLAKAIAILAFLPGDVRVYGMHFGIDGNSDSNQVTEC